MDIQNEKLELIQWITEVRDLSIIGRLKKIKDEYFSSGDWWDVISEEEKKSIEIGLKEKEEGKVIAHDEARNIYEKHL